MIHTAERFGAPSTLLATSPCTCRRILMISRGLIKTCPDISIAATTILPDIQTHDLAGTSATAREDFVAPPDFPLLVSEPATHEIIHRQLDSLLRGNPNQLRQDARVQTQEAF